MQQPQKHQHSTTRRILACGIAILITIPLGLAVRFLPLHLPYLLWKYLGSALWAVALYWFVAMLLPGLSPRSLAVVSGIAATLVELSRLTPERHIDAFRLTLAGKILLGRYFSARNIVVYLVAIVAASASDGWLRAGRR